MRYSSERMSTGQERHRQNAATSSGVGAFVVEIVKIFAIAAMIIVPVRMFLFQPFVVNGASMEPNFHGGEYLIVNEVGYKEVRLGDLVLRRSTRDLRRGDPVVFRFPEQPRAFFIKRVIGLPGERVVIRDGKIRIYNTLHPEGFDLDESYLPRDVITIADQEEYVVGNNEYFVIGDNRGHSYDSRMWGPLDKRYVMGKVLMRLWPPTKIEVFD